MKREKFEIKLNGNPVATRSTFNACVRYSEQQVSRLAGIEGNCRYELKESTMVKEGLYPVSGLRLWVNNKTHTVFKFEFTKLVA